MIVYMVRFDMGAKVDLASLERKTSHEVTSIYLLVLNGILYHQRKKKHIKVVISRLVV